MNEPSRPAPARIRDIVREADMAAADGNFSGAEELYKAALTIQEEASGPSHPDLLPHLLNLASLDAERGRFEAARTAYERCLEIAQSGPPAVRERLDDYHVRLGDLFQRMSNFAGAELHYRQALNMRVQAAGPYSISVREIVEKLSTFHRAQGQTAESRVMDNWLKTIADFRNRKP